MIGPFGAFECEETGVDYVRDEVTSHSDVGPFPYVYEARE